MTIDRCAYAHPGWDGHLLLLHAVESFRRASVAAWACRGLQQDAKIVYTESGRGRLVHDLLVDHGADVAGALTQGTLQAVALEEFYAPAGLAKLVQRALDEGYSSVRLLVGAAAALTVLSAREYAEFEQVVDGLCATRPVSALCQYDRGAAVGVGLDEVTDRHGQGVRELQLQTDCVNGSLRLTGEVDLTNADVLASVLRAATARATATLRVDLSGVSFLDVNGVRALLDGSAPFRERDGYMELMRPQAAVVRVLRLLGIGQVKGVQIAGSVR